MAQKFLKCSVCGNMVAVVKESGVPMVCCGQEMVEVIPRSQDAAVEKHVPEYEVKDGKVFVKVGSVEHPMTEPHYIEWISLQTSKGNQRKVLTPNDKPEAVFAICEDEVVETVYAYCNLHGLWNK